MIDIEELPFNVRLTNYIDAVHSLSMGIFNKDNSKAILAHTIETLQKHIDAFQGLDGWEDAALSSHNK